jgi:hypothetical protein
VEAVLARPRADVLRPVVVLAYDAAGVWTTANQRSIRPPTLRNTGPEPAYNVTISKLKLNDESWCAFDPVAVLAPGEVVTIDPVWWWPDPRETACRQIPLTQAISRSVVTQVLQGRPPITTWTSRIRYEDPSGEPYLGVYRIEVCEFPLRLHTRFVRRL